MTATERAEINRNNAARSTGPRTPEGRSRSKMNAVKHGMTARTPVLPGEDPDAFRARLDAWSEALAPDNVVEQFLVEQAATASWKIERADRVEAARIAAALCASEADKVAGRRKEADSLGRLLLGLDGPVADPTLAQEALRILDPGNPAPPPDRRAPLRPIVDRLEFDRRGMRLAARALGRAPRPARAGRRLGRGPVRPGRPALGAAAAGPGSRALGSAQAGPVPRGPRGAGAQRRPGARRGAGDGAGRRDRRRGRGGGSPQAGPAVGGRPAGGPGRGAGGVAGGGRADEPAVDRAGGGASGLVGGRGGRASGADDVRPGPR